MLLALVLSAAAALAAPGPYVTVGDNVNNLGARGTFPTVTITTPAGSLIGLARNDAEAFTGIPFAQPPVGPLRLAPPVRITTPLTNFDATQQAPACPQMLADASANDIISQVLNSVAANPFYISSTKAQEDCLNINVYRPKGTVAGANLPVLFWIFGGGFEMGYNSQYDGGSLVANSVALGKPFVLVAVNYRVGGFGFMPGKEIKAAGAANLGHLDQRIGLEWTADNIAAFGGDPSKVTIWGESAGAISVWNQMCLYDGNNKYKGNPLFRGGIMNSGGIAPAAPVDSPRAQAIYDRVVSQTVCAGQADTLNCLRGLPYADFLKAANSVPGMLSYTSIALSYLPRPDGKVLTASTDVLAKQNKYAAMPMISGNQEDEGTLFTLFQANSSATTDLITSYLNTVLFPNGPTATVAQLVNSYSPWIWDGWPYGTGVLNEWYIGFKRLASILGDLTFILARRIQLTATTTNNPSIPAWSYLSSYYYGTPVLGTFHGSDLNSVHFGVGLSSAGVKGIQSYYANFVYNLDPNNASGGTSTASAVSFNWPKYDTKSRTMIKFNLLNYETIADTFRSASYDVLSANPSVFQI
ncbi:putative secreted lipase [Vanrija pseudolonga]|uniref:Carboxylic ester hydrolase n=1 Tax=Vanrija pseudolonga TaxID=143232 RepID=A0AAF0YJV2_9TREE|nr:putative secreted lipase [Vanrija pseudolonga]